MRVTWTLGISAVALAAIAGCGGGGGGGVNTTPTPVPTPTPTSTPAPTPTQGLNTAEYRRSDSVRYHNAATAWQDGATGRGVTIGIVDTGIDTDNPEFAGRISAASGNVAGGASIEDPDGHGTMVALVAAAARDNTGIVGIAYDATILVERGDTADTCASDDGCSFTDASIARGVDRAVQSGARIVNLSLGGSAPAPVLTAAIQRAAAAGLVIVVSAGNDADDPDTQNDPAQPDPFAVGVRQAGGANAIIAGSVNNSGAVSSFSNRAGAQASGYLDALGEEVCCVYENGVLKTTTDSTGTYVYVVSGTSFSAPAVAGAAALLIQAFPNLSAQQVVSLLLSSARDTGDPGIDAVYGAGILDISRAFAPQGTLTLAGGTTALALDGGSITTSAAMGDAASRAPALQAIALDGYRRAYRVDVVSAIHGASLRPSLGLSLAAPLRQVGGDEGPISLAFSLDPARAGQPGGWSGALRLDGDDAQRAAVLAGRMVARLSPATRLAFGYAQGADGLAAQVIGADRPAFLVARAPSDDLGFAADGALAFALRHQLGRWGVTVSAENGAAFLPRAATPLDRIEAGRSGYTRLGVGLDRAWGGLAARVAASWLGEDRRVLGARLADALGARGADSVFVDLDLAWRFAPAWSAGAAWRQGYTRARLGGTLAPGSAVVSDAWALDLARGGVFARGDSLALRLSQPLRVASGGLGFTLPVAYDYATLAPAFATLRLPLAPRGRELATELAWRGALWGGSASASVFYRKDPGNYAAAPDDIGAALTWRSGF